MKLRGIEFGQVCGASGVQGFFGEGYPYHKFLRFVPGFNFNGMTFVAKTTTLHPNKGNMPLREDGITPVELKPKCIVVNFRQGVALNAVGLSGPGAEALLHNGAWQERTDPFFISFMSIKHTPEERIDEALMFFEILKKHLLSFRAPICLQINFSCPNVGLDPQTVIEEVRIVLDEAGRLGIPLMPKFNATLTLHAAKEISRHKNCDALCMSNTIPWKDFQDDWKLRYFGSLISPLAHLGGGGVSGEPLLGLVVSWIEAARHHGINVPINAGGGILHPRDIVVLKKAGADSAFLGSVAFLRSWRVSSIIKTANLLL